MDPETAKATESAVDATDSGLRGVEEAIQRDDGHAAGRPDLGVQDGRFYLRKRLIDDGDLTGEVMLAQLEETRRMAINLGHKVAGGESDDEEGLVDQAEREDGGWTILTSVPLTV